VTWSDIFAKFGEDFKILPIFDLLLSLPPTSVACETSFSQMKLIKTSRRSRLSGATLNSLMLVKLESPSVEDFDPDKIVDRWVVSYDIQ
jgi:hypothetical protein